MRAASPARARHGRSLAQGVKFSVHAVSRGRLPTKRCEAGASPPASAPHAARSHDDAGRSARRGWACRVSVSSTLIEAPNNPARALVSPRQRAPSPTGAPGGPGAPARASSGANHAWSCAPCGAGTGACPHRSLSHSPCAKERWNSPTPYLATISCTTCGTAPGRVVRLRGGLWQKRWAAAGAARKDPHLGEDVEVRTVTLTAARNTGGRSWVRPRQAKVQVRQHIAVGQRPDQHVL
jgi:hypothetical protein